MTSLMVILNTRPQSGGSGERRVNVAQLPIFNKVVKDIKNYVARVHHFDRNFITVGFLFCKEVMPYVDHELMQSLIKRTIADFDQLTPNQLSYSCLHSFLLHNNDPKNRKMKEELFNRLEEYLDKNQRSLEEQITRKSAQQFLVSLSATKLGSMKAWRIAENLMQKSLE